MKEQLELFREEKEEVSWDGVWKETDTWGILGGLFVFVAIAIFW